MRTLFFASLLLAINIREIACSNSTNEPVTVCQTASSLSGLCSQLDECTGAVFRAPNECVGQQVCCIDDDVKPSYKENALFTRDMFLKVVGNTTRSRELYYYLIEAFGYAGIEGEYQIAAFVAQVVGETNFLKGLEAEQVEKDFDGQLGNNQTGDGVKFRGRGAILLRGRSDYFLANSKLFGK